MIFKDPWILLFIPVTLALIWFLKKRQKEASLRFSSTELLSDLPHTWKMKLWKAPESLRLLVLCLFLVALAGPRSVLEETEFKAEGIDIVLSIDSSGSMAAEDFVENNRRVNRLTIVKQVVKDFIKGRQHDQLGLVAFAGLAFTVSPLTADYTWLEANLDRIELGLIKDGTAVGSAIVSSVARLKTSQAKSKVIILLTDGISNAGKVDPITAAKTAKAYGIKIYTIGAGTKGAVPFPARDLFGRKVYQNVVLDVDEETLKEIARITGGQYFRATDTESLRKIYKDIDALEKTEIEKIGYFEYEEWFDKILIVTLALLVLEIMLSGTVLLRIP